MNGDEGPKSSGVTTGQQFEDALRTAEALMKQADCEQERADRLLAAEIGTVAITIAIAIIIAIVGLSSGFAGRVLVVIAGGLAGLVVAELCTSPFGRASLTSRIAMNRLRSMLSVCSAKSLCSYRKSRTGTKPSCDWPGHGFPVSLSGQQGSPKTKLVIRANTRSNEARRKFQAVVSADLRRAVQD